MVKVLLKLKWTYFLATFKNNPWVIVGFAFGALYGAGLLVSFSALMWFAGENAGDMSLVALAGTGTLLGVLWWVIPIFSSGADATLDPERLVLFPLRTRDIQWGQLLGGLIGLPGFFTLATLLLSALAMRSSAVALLAFLPLAALNLAVILIGSRIISLVSIRLNSIRGFKTTFTIVGFLLLIALGPIIVGAISTAFALVDYALPAAQVLSYTPLASGLAAIYWLSQGAWLTALLQIVLTAAYAVAGWKLWARVQDSMMSRIGELSGESSAKEVELGNIGIFARFPATARGAIAARNVHMLLKDPRCSLNVIMIPAMYIIFGFFGRISFGNTGEVNPSLGINPFLLIFIPAMAGYVYMYLVSYENSAFSMHVCAPLRGIDDRLGRAYAILLLMGPSIILGPIFMSWLNNSMDTLPATLALSICLFLAGIGISAFVDMVMNVPAPPPGSSPWKTPKQSDGFSKGLARFAVLLILWAFAIPGSIPLMIYSFGGASYWLWISVVISLTVGVAIFWVGITVGAKRYDRFADKTLQRVSAFKA